MQGRGWLAAGALAGALLAAASIVERGPTAARVPADAVAVVNGVPIARTDYQRAMAAVAADRRTVDDALRQRVLDRLIDEELLVQRGVELGLATRDPRVRTDLGAAVIELVVSRADEQAAPTDTELRAFYEGAPSYFARPDRVRVEHVLYASETDARAGADPVRQTRTPVPDQLLPIAKLADYVGPTAARAAAALRPGESTAPVATAAGWRVLRVVDRIDGGLPPFEDLRDLVRAEWQRRSGDRALQDFLERQRAAAAIGLAEDHRSKAAR